MPKEQKDEATSMAWQFVDEFIVPNHLKVGLVFLGFGSFLAMALDKGYSFSVTWVSFLIMIFFGGAMGVLQALARRSRIQRKPEVYAEAYAYWKRVQSLQLFDIQAVWQAWRTHGSWVGMVRQNPLSVAVYVVLGSSILLAIANLANVLPGTLKPPSTVFLFLAGFYFADALWMRRYSTVTKA